jgi:hypothetical protein
MLLLMLLLHLEENEEEHLFASFTKDIFIMFSPMIMRESKHRGNSERFFRLLPSQKIFLFFPIKTPPKVNC